MSPPIIRQPDLWERQAEFTKWLVKGFPEYKLQGLSLRGACAITGNATVENQAKPQTLGQKDHGSDGVLQWRLARLEGPYGLYKWAKDRGLKWNTLYTQAAFTLWELEHGEFPGDRRYQRLQEELRAGVKKIETLTANFCKVYERPNMAVAHLNLRIRHAKSVYLLMGGNEMEKGKSTPGTTIATGGAAVGGAVIAATNTMQGGSDFSTGSIIIMALLLASTLWQMGRRENVEKGENLDEIEIIPSDIPFNPEPLVELTVNPTTAFEAAEKRCEELREQLRDAILIRDAEKAKLEKHVDELLALVNSSRVSGLEVKKVKVSDQTKEKHDV